MHLSLELRARGDGSSSGGSVNEGASASYRPACRASIFRGLNLAGKYCRALGNSPGRLNHWSSRAIRRPVAKFFDVEQVVTPLP